MVLAFFTGFNILAFKFFLFYPIVWHDDINVASLFFNHVYANLDGDWPLHCYIQYMITAVSSYVDCIAFSFTGSHLVLK